MKRSKPRIKTAEFLSNQYKKYCALTGFYNNPVKCFNNWLLTEQG